MAYTPNEHTTIDEQLVVFRRKCPESKPGNYGIKLWVAADAKNFYACSMQVYTDKSGGVRQKKQGLRVVKDTVCHTHGTRRGVTTDNFFTICELANFLSVGTLRKNKPEIPALFLSGKQRNVRYSVFGFTSDLTLVSYVPARNKTVIHPSSQHHDNTCTGEKKDDKPEIIMHYNATKSAVDVLDKLVKEYVFTRSTRCWPLKLFLSLIDIACVNAFVLWMLKYPNWQQKQNN